MFKIIVTYLKGENLLEVRCELGPVNLHAAVSDLFSSSGKPCCRLLWVAIPFPQSLLSPSLTWTWSLGWSPPCCGRWSASSCLWVWSFLFDEWLVGRRRRIMVQGGLEVPPMVHTFRLGFSSFCLLLTGLHLAPLFDEPLAMVRSFLGLSSDFSESLHLRFSGILIKLVLYFPQIFVA